MAQQPLFDPLPPGPAGPQRTPRAPTTILSVIQLNDLVKGALAGALPAAVHVAGEIQDLSGSGSGHVYFTLKDAHSELRCVMWRSAAIRLRFAPTDGLQVVATGGVEVYPPRGVYQLVVRSLEPRGVGALELAMRQLREKLQREGLLDPRRRRPLPKYPRRLAILTSLHGAALRDMLQTLARRYPPIEVLVLGVQVQGDGAARSIAGAIGFMNTHAERLGGIDVAIVGRGGGSLEDLWAFNEEMVARAILASRIRIISAVGHETDVTIADLVADLRAPTPTAAAELAVPDAGDLCKQLEERALRISRLFAHRIEAADLRLKRCLDRAPLRRPLARFAELADRLEKCSQQLHHVIRRHIAAAADHLANLEQQKLRSGAGHLLAARERLSQRTYSLARAFEGRFALESNRVAKAALQVNERLPARLHRASDRIEQLARRITTAARTQIDRTRLQLDSRVEGILARDPRRVLQRGYSITRDAATGRVIRSSREVEPGEILETETADGRIQSTANADPAER